MSPENVWISRMTLSGRNIFLKISQTSPVWTCPCLSVRKTYEKHISIEEEKSHRKGNKWRERINEQERKRKQEKSSLVRWRTFIDAVAIDGIDNGSMSVSFGRARATSQGNFTSSRPCQQFLILLLPVCVRATERNPTGTTCWTLFAGNLKLRQSPMIHAVFVQPVR